MTRKPENFQWIGYTDEQIELLDFIDFVGNNAWDRNGQTETLMPSLLTDCAAAGLTIDRVKERYALTRVLQGRAAHARPVGEQTHHREVRPLTRCRRSSVRCEPWMTKRL